MNKELKTNEFRQVVRGVLKLEEAEIDPSLGLKIGLYRDCYPLVTRIFYLEENQRELKYELAFTHEGTQPMGVRLVAAPAEVPDDQVMAVENHQQYIAASEFKDNIARVDLELSPALYLVWRRFCRTYTIRGRVVCRRIVWKGHKPHLCISPVRGATVTAFDVDRILWWHRKDRVAKVVTDVNGNFEMTFRFCCWWWLLPLHRWELNPNVIDRIRDLLKQVPLPGPIPRPEPELDLGLINRLAEQLTPTPLSLPVGEALETSQSNLQAIGRTLVEHLPAADLQALHIWPWFNLFDCRPDIIFRVTQDCGDGDEIIYNEDYDDTRWNIPSVLDGVTLVANENACCVPCCDERPDGDCFIFHGVGCGGYPITNIEQNSTSPLAGYGSPGSGDRPFGRNIRLLGAFGDASDVDFYKFQYRRWQPDPVNAWTSWIDMPADQMGKFNRWHWNGTGYQKETVKPETIDSQDVYRTIDRYREENPGLPLVDPINSDYVGIWDTAQVSGNMETPIIPDGLYELQAIGYEYDAATNSLINEHLLTLCPEPGQGPDPGHITRMLLRVDNRYANWTAGSVHINTSEPDCDFPNNCAVIKNEGQPDEECVSACGIIRLSADDTLTIRFNASDSDGHLSHYRLSAHWAESEVFNVLSVGTPEPDYAESSPNELVGPNYSQTFTGSQGLYRASLPVTEDEHDRPFWYGGDYKITLNVGDPVPGTSHRVFETCCAYLLRLDVWKRTTSGCGDIHRNQCEFSFTVIREDLTDDPNCPDV